MSLKTFGPPISLNANFFKETSNSKEWTEETDGNSGLANRTHCSLRGLKNSYMTGQKETTASTSPWIQKERREE